MSGPSRKRRPYRTSKVFLCEFNELAEKISRKWGVLVGVERVTGYTDVSGVRHAPAFNVHVDGLAFRVASLPAAIGLLTGFDSGREFSDTGAGRGCVTEVECAAVCRRVMAEGGAAFACEPAPSPSSPLPLV
jgi:hypothetical protein